MLTLTRAQVRRIDELALSEYGIPGIVLMENAARAVADIAFRMTEDPERSVVIFCGGGNNGGDGLAAARHLHNLGVAVTIVKVFDESRLSPDAATHWRIVGAMKLPIIEDFASLPKTQLIIDALLGTGVTQPPRERIASAIRAINAAGTPVLAVDVPSGLDCDTGQPIGDACVRATRTITMAAKKTGFLRPASYPFTGVVTVADIGCPGELIARVIAAVS